MIVQQAQQYILTLFNQKQTSELLYHNYALTDAIVKQIKLLANHSKAPDQSTEIALIAGYFSQTKLLGDVEDALVHLQHFFQKTPYEQMQKVVTTLKNYEQQSIKSISEALLADAIHFVEYGDNYWDWTNLRKLEMELTFQSTIAKVDWQKDELERLLNVKFYTPYAKINYAPLVAQNIAKLKARIDKTTPSASASKSISINERGAQTFFRANYRNHINLSAIADNKANIMISVNSILISVLITIMTWRNITEVNPKVILPAVIFLITGLASLIFAVLSARPKITNANKNLKDQEIIKQNITFFGSFIQLPLEEYEQAMEEVLSDEDLLYGNMRRDLYFLGKVLAQKYYYLTISYNIFMVGFILAVVLFLIFFLMQ